MEWEEAMEERLRCLAEWDDAAYLQTRRGRLSDTVLQQGAPRELVLAEWDAQEREASAEPSGPTPPFDVLLAIHGNARLASLLPPRFVLVRSSPAVLANAVSLTAAVIADNAATLGVFLPLCLGKLTSAELGRELGMGLQRLAHLLSSRSCVALLAQQGLDPRPHATLLETAAGVLVEQMCARQSIEVLANQPRDLVLACFALLRPSDMHLIFRAVLGSPLQPFLSPQLVAQAAVELAAGYLWVQLHGFMVDVARERFPVVPLFAAPVRRQHFAPWPSVRVAVSEPMPEERELVADEEAFAMQMDRFTGGVLLGFDMSNVLVSGSACVAAVLVGAPESPEYENSDVDLFFYGVEKRAMMQRIVELHAHLSAATQGQVLTIRNSRSVSFVLPYPLRRMAVCLLYFASPAAILRGADVCVTGLGWTGSQLLATFFARAALTYRWTLAVEAGEWKRGAEVYGRRVGKYCRRGFAAVCETEESQAVSPGCAASLAQELRRGGEPRADADTLPPRSARLDIAQLEAMVRARGYQEDDLYGNGEVGFSVVESIEELLK